MPRPRRSNLQTAEVPVVTNEANESTILAMELAGAYHRMVRFYHQQLGMALPDADRRARGQDYTPEEAAADLARIRDRPPDQVSWFDLNRLVERDPEMFSAVWSGMKAAARQELESGQRTAKALSWESQPWERARFLAIRDSLRGDSPPQPGVETALVELAAEAYADYLEWSEHLHMPTSTEVQSERQILEHDGTGVRCAWATRRRSRTRQPSLRRRTSASCARSRCFTSGGARTRSCSSGVPPRSMSASTGSTWRHRHAGWPVGVRIYRNHQASEIARL